MINPRFVPLLLLRGRGLVKTIRFGGGRYLGDALNAAAIFNSKMVDEITVLDVDAPRQQRGPVVDVLRDLASECFMPLTYGGGIRRVSDVEAVIAAGAEKVVITSAFFEVPSLVNEAAVRFGSQSVVVGLDVRRGKEGFQAYTWAGRVPTGVDPVTAARRAVEAGAGEILVQSIDRDGTWTGYDFDLVRRLSAAVPVSVVAAGGASTLDDMAFVIERAGASAAAAGSLFVFFGRLKAVLINVPNETERSAALSRARISGPSHTGAIDHNSPRDLCSLQN